MSLKYGFYNSLNGDRKYDAVQISQMFDGLIQDGIFSTIGTAMIVLAAGNTPPDMNVNVGVGKAWFNHTWTTNDTILPITIDTAEAVLNRLDAVILEIDASDEVRENSIKIIKGVPGSGSISPDLVHTEYVHQYPLCFISVKPGVTTIQQSDILNNIGTEQCPFITGILESVNIEGLWAQWATQFDEWFAYLQTVFTEGAIGELLVAVEEVQANNPVIIISSSTPDPVVNGAIWIKY